MKIGIVTPHDYFKNGGVPDQVRSQYTILKERGYDVKVLTPMVKKTAPAVQPKDVIYVGQAAEMSNPLATSTELGFSVESKLIDKTLEQEKFDILHFHEPWVPVIARQILARSKAKNVATFHAKLPESVVNKSLEVLSLPYTKTTIKYFDAITAVSEAGADFVRSVTDKKITIIPNGIDLSKFDVEKVKATSLKDPTKKTILFVGRLERRKGCLQLLRAFEHLAYSDDEFELLIVGDGPRRTQLENYVRNFSIPNVKFLGFVDEKTKIELFKTADVYVSPALFGESFGIVLIEAMSMGTPVIAGNNPGYACVMKGAGQLGLVDPKNSEELAKRIRIFATEPAVIELMSQWALRECQQYDFSNTISGYEKIYKQLMS